MAEGGDRGVQGLGHPLPPHQHHRHVMQAPKYPQMTSEDQLPKSSAIMETPVQLKSCFHGLSSLRFPEHLLDLLPEHLMKQLGILNLLLKEVQHNIQEHHNQVNSFLRQMEKCNKLLKKQTTELDLGWAAEELAGPKLPQCAPARSPQDPPDTADPKSSDRLPQALRGDERPPPHDTKPQFWHDALTQELRRLFLRASHSEVTAQVGGSKVLEPSDLGEWEKEPEEEEEEVEEEEETMTLGKRVRFQTGQFYSHQPVSMVAKSILCPPKDSPQPPESQELPDAMGPFLKPLTWDPEDFEDTWDRTAAEPGRSKRFAVPHRVEKVRVLNHGEPVLSAAVSSFSRHAFSCSKGGVKVWSLAGQMAEDRFPESHLRPAPQGSPARGSYLRTCLLASDNSTLLAGGRHLAGVKLWDLSASSLYVKSELPCPALSCQSLAAKVEENLVLAGFSEGIVRVWDLRVHSGIRDISCPLNGARSLAVKSHKVWAGGLDACLRCWDLRMAKELRKFPFNSQIMSLCQSPQDDQLILGLANGQHWLQPSAETPAHMAGSKGELILGVTFSPYGQWWASVGMDDMVTVHAMPTGAKVFQVPETSGINCCAVSSSNRLVVTGSQHHATVYQVTY
ncbi:PREDICTED: transducin-like enhancer protein 6 isoform X1 [Dipodomys ordii]|uniref:Transducin-like enhancer protein 6 n=1 Tax=Dipodomys ordii TaxID=10020 RepID=A0A1S3FNT3_DIPOR|nr:PREDICTED: transducin-like enhancer protein 6 isoform X1 [Dipodomys ordii]